MLCWLRDWKYILIIAYLKAVLDYILHFIFIYLYYHWNTMGMSHLKIINTGQGYIHKYENLKRKLYNCNVNIYFNQKCLLTRDLLINIALSIVHSIFLKKFSMKMAPDGRAEICSWDIRLKIHFNNCLFESCVRLYFIFYSHIFVLPLEHNGVVSPEKKDS